MEGVKIKKCDYFEDERGWLLKVIQKEDLMGQNFGEVYITTAHPGIIKANHYHMDTDEWFCIIKGTAKLVLEDIESGETKEIILGTERFRIIKVPKKIAHAVKNIGDDLMYLLAIADQPYDNDDPDTYPYDIHI